jgi:hypothetical protein
MMNYCLLDLWPRCGDVGLSNSIQKTSGVFMFAFRRALLAAVAIIVATASASAVVFNPATNPLPGPPQDTLYTWTTNPAVFADSWYSDDANGDVGNQSAADVESVLETATWLGTALSFVSGGACTDSANCTTGSPNSGTWTFTSPANVFGIHFDDRFIAILYASAQSAFSISNLTHGVSNIYAYCSLENCNTGGGGSGVVPLPPALLLFGTALAGMTLLLRRRRRA